MWVYIVRRLLWLPVLLVATSLVTFTLLRFGPGDPAEVILGARYNETAAQQIEEVIGCGYTPMLDKYQRGALGGTGRTFDWRVARELASRYDLVLAGGLTPDNVARAISEVRPGVVDVSSGVETGGVKDAAKIRRFAEEVRRAG